MTRFRGHKTGFNRTGSNDVTPMLDGSATEFYGRGAVPSGKLEVPKGLASIDTAGNRRMAKAIVGHADGHKASFSGTNAFSRGKRR